MLVAIARSCALSHSTISRIAHPVSVCSDIAARVLTRRYGRHIASVFDLIGETPLIEVTRFDRGLCRLFLKPESASPSGSIKDRPAAMKIT